MLAHLLDDLVRVVDMLNNLDQRPAERPARPPPADTSDGEVMELKRLLNSMLLWITPSTYGDGANRVVGGHLVGHTRRHNTYTTFCVV